MARYGGTNTVQPAQFNSAQANFVWVMTEANFAASAIDGGAQSILNGGGNLRCYTDDTKSTQLPIEVVEFVTGVTPSIVVWGLSPLLDNASTVYIEADTVAISQPPVTDPFGRNATWSDYEAVLHMNETGTNGVFADSTGNGHNSVLSTGASLPTTSVGHPFGSSWPTFNKTQSLSLTNSAQVLNNSDMYMSAWVNLVDSSASNGLIGNRYRSGDTESFSSQASTRVFIRSTNGEDIYLGSNIATGQTHSLVSTYSAASMQSFLNGSLDGENSSLNNVSGINTPVGRDFRIGTYFDSGNTVFGLNGSVGEARLARYKPTADRVDAEHKNQGSTPIFWSVGAWEDQDAGGITIPGATTGYFQIPINGQLDLASEITIIGATTGYLMLPVDGSIVTTPEIEVIGQTTAVSYLAIDGDLDLTPEINIPLQTTGYTQLPINSSLDLSGQISIDGETTSYSQNSINGDILLTGNINITGSTTQQSMLAVDGVIKLFAGGELDLSNLKLKYVDGFDVGYNLQSIKVQYK